MKPDQPFYLWLEEEQTGPYTLYQLRGLWTNGVITGLTLYWQESMPDWQPLSQITRLIEQPDAPPPTAPSPPKLVPTAKRGEIPGSVAVFVIVLLLAGVACLYAYGQKEVAAGRRPFYQFDGATSSAGAKQFTIRVRGTTGIVFRGSFGADGQSRTVTDTIPMDYQCEGRSCGVVMQKANSSGSLEVSIERDYDQISQQSTAAPYGVVTLSAR